MSPSSWGARPGHIGGALLLSMIALTSITARAEPYLAVDQGQKCIACHVNPTGGGLRNAYGVHFARTGLAAYRLPEGLPTWSGGLGDWVRLGGDWRWSTTRTDVPQQPRQRNAGTDQLRAYAGLTLPGEHVELYLDGQLSPGKATTQEAYLRLNGSARQWHLKGGQIYLPFGWRLQDSTAFVRAVSGIGMSTPERGAELGVELGDWSAQVALTRPLHPPPGSSDRQTTAQLVWVQPWGRIGAAAASAQTTAGKRQAWAVYGGLRTGPVAWLAEVDLVRDSGYPEGRRSLLAALGELNWKVAQGHNLKFTAEHFDPDRRVGEDHKVRRSLVYEFTPLPFVQLRLGTRQNRGIPQNAFDNRRSGFLELHGLL
jgi:hypothetical protein